MIRRLLSAIILLLVCVVAPAQESCIIKGHIADCQLAGGQKIKKVYLTRTDEAGNTVLVATAKVKKGSYTFEYDLAPTDPVLMYTITGFGDGKAIELFVEPGEVFVSTGSAVSPELSTVMGTPTNNDYSHYKAIPITVQQETDAKVDALVGRYGREWLDTDAGRAEVNRIAARDAIRVQAMQIRFLIEHNASPMTPFEIERSLLSKLSTPYAEQITKAISTTLHSHPYYISLRNRMLSDNMKVGNEVPDITLSLENGDVAHLADYRGKYVVLNFWSIDCEKSAQMIAELQNLYDVIKDYDQQFVIVSLALEGNVEEWKNSITGNNIRRDGWVHACDTATASLAADLFNVENTPKIVLIEPEGRAVSLDMEIDEVVMRAEQILMGDLYYLDQID